MHRAALLILGFGWPLAAAIDAGSDVLLRWPLEGAQPKQIELLKEAGVTEVLLAWPEARSAAPFVRSCREAGLVPIAELPVSKSAAEALKLVKEAHSAGFGGIAFDADGAFSDAKALRAFVDSLPVMDVLVYLKPEQVTWRVRPAQAVLKYGQWPGVRSGPTMNRRDMEVSSASREPWVDANAYLVAYLRGMFPERAAWLGYRPDEAGGVAKDRLIANETVEMALVEAFVAGGNFVVSLPPRYHAGLIAGEEKALASWRSLAQTVQFLKAHLATFRQQGGSRVAVAAGTIDQSGEVLNMMYRRNMCPAVFPAGSLPELEPGRWRAAVWANIAPFPASVKRLLGYAGAGGLLIAAPETKGGRAWWLDPSAKKLRADEDRDFYAFQKGHVLAYREPIEDPSEFALDVIDAVGVRTRDLRLWDAGSVMGLLNRLEGGKLAVELINYGSLRDRDFPVRVEGNYRRATLIEPGAAAPRPLKASKRGTGTEIRVEKLNRLAVIVME